MPTTSELNILLEQILGCVIQHPAFTREEGTGIEEPGHYREIAELERLAEHLSLIVRDVRNRQAMLQARQNNLWNVPRSERYGASASVRDQQSDTQKTLDLANRIQEQLEKMMADSGTLGAGDISHGVGEIIEKIYHHAHHESGEQIIPGQMAYMPASAHVQGGVEAATIMVYVALQAFIHATRRKTKAQSA